MQTCNIKGTGQQLSVTRQAIVWGVSQLLLFLKENALKLSIGGLYRKLKLRNCTAAQNKALGWIEAAGEQRRASHDFFQRAAQSSGWF